MDIEKLLKEITIQLKISNQLKLIEIATDIDTKNLSETQIKMFDEITDSIQFENK